MGKRKFWFIEELGPLGKLFQLIYEVKRQNKSNITLNENIGMSHCEVEVSKDILAHIEKLKNGKVGEYIIYKIDKSVIVKEDSKGIAKTPKGIADRLPRDDCRFVVYNYKSGSDEHEPLLINW